MDLKCLFLSASFLTAVGCSASAEKPSFSPNITELQNKQGLVAAAAVVVLVSWLTRCLTITKPQKKSEANLTDHNDHFLNKIDSDGAPFIPSQDNFLAASKTFEPSTPYTGQPDNENDDLIRSFSEEAREPIDLRVLREERLKKINENRSHGSREDGPSQN